MRQGHNLSVFENRVLRKIYGSRRDEVTGERRRLLMRRVMVKEWWGNLRERDHLEGLDVDGRIILKLVFKK